LASKNARFILFYFVGNNLNNMKRLLLAPLLFSN